MRISELTLVTIMHKPSHDPLFIRKIYESQETIEQSYLEKIAVISNVTDSQVEKSLMDLDFKVFKIEKKGVAHARRSALKIAIEVSENTHFHYCDLDRLLTWATYHPSELIALKESLFASNADYIIIGRTDYAFDTHPTSWKKTEQVANSVFSTFCNFDVDITAGSAGMSRDALQVINKHTNDSYSMTDAEWPLLVFQTDSLLGSIRVNGLRYDDNLNASCNRSSEIVEWESRINLMNSVLEVVFVANKTKTH
ncbi:hypothetical protein [Metaplanococcus flavidus]|uniref:Glycosyltransferase n=1 Tax=Metaplanococcus flavidus TaxID=569883 RepID=A0ABW3LC27_9BACL